MDGRFTNEPIPMDTDVIENIIEYDQYLRMVIENIQKDAELIASYARIRVEDIDFTAPIAIVATTNAIPDKEYIRYLHLAQGKYPVDLVRYYVDCVPSEDQGMAILYVVPKVLLNLVYEPVGQQPFLLWLGFLAVRPAWVPTKIQTPPEE